MVLPMWSYRMTPEDRDRDLERALGVAWDEQQHWTARSRAFAATRRQQANNDDFMTFIDEFGEPITDRAQVTDRELGRISDRHWGNNGLLTPRVVRQDYQIRVEYHGDIRARQGTRQGTLLGNWDATWVEPETMAGHRAMDAIYGGNPLPANRTAWITSYLESFFRLALRQQPSPTLRSVLLSLEEQLAAHGLLFYMYTTALGETKVSLTKTSGVHIQSFDVTREYNAAENRIGVDTMRDIVDAISNAAERLMTRGAEPTARYTGFAGLRSLLQGEAGEEQNRHQDLLPELRFPPNPGFIEREPAHQREDRFTAQARRDLLDPAPPSVLADLRIEPPPWRLRDRQENINILAMERGASLREDLAWGAARHAYTVPPWVRGAAHYQFDLLDTKSLVARMTRRRAPFHVPIGLHVAEAPPLPYVLARPSLETYVEQPRLPERRKGGLKSRPQHEYVRTPDGAMVYEVLTRKEQENAHRRSPLVVILDRAGRPIQRRTNLTDYGRVMHIDQFELSFNGMGPMTARVSGFFPDTRESVTIDAPYREGGLAAMALDALAGNGPHGDTGATVQDIYITPAEPLNFPFLGSPNPAPIETPFEMGFANYLPHRPGYAGDPYVGRANTPLPHPRPVIIAGREFEVQDSAGARKIALELFRSHLTDDEQREFDESGRVHIRVKSGNLYRIKQDACMNVFRVENNREVEKLCVIPKGDSYPMGDMLVMQLFMLRMDEMEFRRKANIWKWGRDKYGFDQWVSFHGEREQQAMAGINVIRGAAAQYERLIRNIG